MGRKKVKKETEEGTKTENEKWKLIEEEQEIRKTNYVNIFLEADKRKNNKKGFKKNQVTKKQRKHYSEKILQKEIGKKKEAFVRQESREEPFPCFWKKVVDSEKTQKENKKRKERMKNTFKKHKRHKKNRN